MDLLRRQNRLLQVLPSKATVAAPGPELTHRVTEELGAAIVSGHWPQSGVPLTDTQLSEHYGVSRGTIREAVKALATKGLLGMAPRHGIWVEPESSWNLLDPDVLRWLPQQDASLTLVVELAEMRLAIEPMAAALAARGGGIKGAIRVRNAMARIVAARRGTGDPLSSEISFHVSILHAAGNRLYAQLSVLVDTALRISFHRSNQIVGKDAPKLQRYGRICDAIVASDERAAMTEMHDQIQDELDLLYAREAAE